MSSQAAASGSSSVVAGFFIGIALLFAVILGILWQRNRQLQRDLYEEELQQQQQQYYWYSWYPEPRPYAGPWPEDRYHHHRRRHHH